MSFARSRQRHLCNGTLLAMALAGSTRIEVTDYRSDLGRWRAAQRRAEPRLRDYVLGYFASEGFLPRPLHERHLPSREVAIVLNFAAPHRIIDPSDPKRTTEHRNAWIVALQHRHQIREAFGARDFMVIRLTPIGAQMLLGMPMNLLTDRTLALEDVDSRFSRLLTDHAEATHDWAARFDIVENIIAARLASAPPPPAGLLRSWRIAPGVSESCRSGAASGGIRMQPAPSDRAVPQIFRHGSQNDRQDQPLPSGCRSGPSRGAARSLTVSGGKTVSRLSGGRHCSQRHPDGRCGGRIWRSAAATMTSPISSTSSGLSPD